MSDSFQPTYKGEFVIEQGTPTRTRRINGQIVREAVYRPSDDPIEGCDELLQGITRDDLGGPASGFAAHYRAASAGSGPPDIHNRDRSSGDYSNDLMGGGEQHLDQNWEISESYGEDDLFGQPATEPRTEHGDFTDTEYSARGNGPNDYSEEDFFDMDFFDMFQDSERQPASEQQNDQNKPKRQYEASYSSDPLDDIFGDDSDTFNSRGL